MGKLSAICMMSQQEDILVAFGAVWKRWDRHVRSNGANLKGMLGEFK